MRHIKLLLFLLCFGSISPLQAQDRTTIPLAALNSIEAAATTGAAILDLSGLDLTELPPILWQLHNLQELNLFSNSLSSLPPEIGQLTNLKVLNLASNQLNSLPIEIWQLSNLEVLNLTANHLINLPSEIGQLTNLQVLPLRENQLASLPAEIGRLTNLCYLDVAHNNLRHLPNTLGNLTQLIQVEPEYCYKDEIPIGLYISGNPLITPPPEVIAEGTLAILAYLRNQAWWHLQRLMIGGASGIGVLVIVFLALRWRYRRQYGKKKKRE